MGTHAPHLPPRKQLTPCKKRAAMPVRVSRHFRTGLLQGWY